MVDSTVSTCAYATAQIQSKEQNWQDKTVHWNHPLDGAGLIFWIMNFPIGFDNQVMGLQI